MHAPSRMRSIGLVAAGVAGALIFAVSATMAEGEYCGKRQDILKLLQENLREKRSAYGRTSDGRVLEVFAAPSGSWTVLVTYPSGLSCLVTRGVEWHQIERQQEDPVSMGGD